MNSGSLGSNRNKHFGASKEKFDGNSGDSSVEPAVPNGPKQLENGPKSEQQSVSKDDKHEFMITSSTIPTSAKQPWQQQSDQQYFKREKKKQVSSRFVYISKKFWSERDLLNS